MRVEGSASHLDGGNSCHEPEREDDFCVKVSSVANPSLESVACGSKKRCGWDTDVLAAEEIGLRAGAMVGVCYWHFTC